MKPICTTRFSTLAAFAVSLGSLGACAEEIDPDQLSVSIEGYESWDKVEPLLGPVPGHGDTYRVMYRNDIARSYSGAGEYPVGSAIVKEIYELKGGDERGSLLYKAVMRRLDGEVDPGVPLDDGWLFTQIDSGTAEAQRDLCWDSCHVNAPYLGAYFDHGY